ncbi:MAG: hypothetical protein Q9191_000152 [Dirinaria sp. TL-2023a]
MSPLLDPEIPTMFKGNAKQDGRGPDDDKNDYDHDFSRAIIDIRADKQQLSLLETLRTSLAGGPSGDSPPTFPSLLLWDANGLKLFEAITYSDEYYLTQSEIHVLEKYGKEMAKKIAPNTMMVELGSGNLRKITILLKALDSLGTEVDYYALDLSESELERSLKQIPSGAFKHVRCRGLLGTYDDGRQWLQRPENVHRPKCILSMGSTIGSFTRPEAAQFLAGFANSLTCKASSTDPQHGGVSSILVGVDACMSPERVRRAYCDPAGRNSRFVLNALGHANHLLGYEAFDPEHWVVRGEWNPALGVHDQYLVPMDDVVFGNRLLKSWKAIPIVHSFKYNTKQQEQLWADAGLSETDCWSNEDGTYGIHLLSTTKDLPN